MPMISRGIEEAAMDSIARPIPPSPAITTTSLCRMLACSMACMPQAIGSTSAACSTVSESGTLWFRAVAGSFTYSAKPPSQQCLNPYTADRVHIQYTPSVQNRHSSQGTICSETTRSPTSYPVTPSPSSTTSPTNSCPPVTGASMYRSSSDVPQIRIPPWNDLVSPAQTPHASTLSRISPGPMEIGRASCRERV